MKFNELKWKKIDGTREYDGTRFSLFETYSDIDPELAEDLLAKSSSGREVGGSTLQNIIDDIEGGDFQSLEDLIRIDSEGNLQDGNHRCTAVKRTGKSLPTQRLVKGFPPELFKYMDQGRKRSAKDTLSVVGVENPSCTASTIRLWKQIQAGRRGHSFKARNQEILASQRSMKGLNESVAFALTMAKEIGVPPHSYSVNHYLSTLSNAGDARTFWDMFSNGPRHDKSSPPNALYYHLQSLVSHKLKQQAKGAKYLLAPVDVCIDIHNAWMHFQADMPMTDFKSTQEDAWNDLRSELQRI